jgi:hypothetical protein
MPLHAKEYSSRSRGKWTEYEHLCRLAPDGWKEKKQIEISLVESGVEDIENTAETKKQRSTWARLIKKVYGTDPLTCPKCLYPMKVVAIIMNSEETKKILQHLIKIGRAPPNFDPASLN